MPALAKVVEEIRAVADVVIDSYFIVDADRTIVDFNRAFHAMLPRSVARGLRGKKCYDVLQLEICAEQCIAQRCWKSGKQLRLDEIQGKVARVDKQLTFILSGRPFFDDKQRPIAALVVHRNVTDEAQVQVKYQEMLDSAKREREQLKHVIRRRTADLLESTQKLRRVQRELMEFKRGRIL